MNKTISEAVDFIDRFLPEVKGINDRDIVIAPPFTALMSVSSKLNGTNVMSASQNVFYEEKGAFTGEISALMLRDIGAAFVIIGHSERRQYFGETDETVNKKIKTCLGNSLGVIFCIGELLSERNSGRTFDVLKTQLQNGLRDIAISNVVVAYEPVWAIGTGITAAPEQADEAHRYIRSELRGLYGNAADETRILYGGSVTPENVDTLMSLPDVDGTLVGGASLKVESFAKIVRFKGDK